jgi:membrane-bound serine protease (ClpP class)
VSGLAVRAQEPPAAKAESRLVSVPASPSIDRLRTLESRIGSAVEEGATSILLHLRGGRADPLEALDAADRLYGLGGARADAFLAGRARGGIALLALACGRIVLTSSSQIGPIDCSGEEERATVLAAARRYRSGEAALLVEAMIDPGLELHLVRYRDGKSKIVEEGELAAALANADAHGGLRAQELLVREDKLLALSADRAVALGIAEAIVEDVPAAADRLGVELPAASAASSAEPQKGVFRTGAWKPKQCKKAAIIFVEGDILEGLEARVKRRIAQVKADGSFDLLVIETDSPGGGVGSSLEVGDLIFETGAEMHTVAWIKRKALSGAALTSFAARDIVMSTAGTIGDCEPIVLAPGGYETLGEKIQSPLRATFRKYSQRNGHPVAIGESMVSSEAEVFQVTAADGSRRYFTSEQYWELEPEQQERYGETKIVVAEGKLPTFTAQEALRLDVSRATANSRRELLELYGVSEANAVVFEVTWSEELSDWLLRHKFILFLIGLVALYMEFKAPGFGVAGFIGIAAFTLYFFAGMIGGVADSLEIVLFVAGVALLIVEIFVTPGFGLPGIAGLLLIIVSLYLGSTPFTLPDTPRAREFLLDWMVQFGGAIVGATILAILLARFLPSAPLFRRIMLVPPGDAAGLSASGATAERPVADAVGQRGVALTDLRPAGRIRLGDRRIDVVTQGSFVEEGATVEVTRIKGNRIVVRPVKDETKKPGPDSGTDRDYNY